MYACLYVCKDDPRIRYPLLYIPEKEKQSFKDLPPHRYLELSLLLSYSIQLIYIRDTIIVYR